MIEISCVFHKDCHWNMRTVVVHKDCHWNMRTVVLCTKIAQCGGPLHMTFFCAMEDIGVVESAESATVQGDDLPTSTEETPLKRQRAMY